MSSFLYFLATIIFLLGLLLVGGFIGRANSHQTYSSASKMSQLVGGRAVDDGSGSAGHNGECASCKWY